MKMTRKLLVFLGHFLKAEVKLTHHREKQKYPSLEAYCAHTPTFVPSINEWSVLELSVVMKGILKKLTGTVLINPPVPTCAA